MLRWMQASVFLLMEILAAAGSDSFTSVLVRDGDDATLPCQNVINNPEKCDSADWTLNFRRGTEELVKEGEVLRSAERLSVTPDCALLIKKTTRNDAQLYNCRQDKDGVLADFQVALSVISIIRMQPQARGQTQLLCSAATHNSCQKTDTKWLYDGQKVHGDGDVSVLPHSACSVSVLFHASRARDESKFQCEVKDEYTQKTFSVIPLPSGWRPYAAVAGVVLLLLLLLLGVVGTIHWIRRKTEASAGDKAPIVGHAATISDTAFSPKASDKDADPEDVSYASVSYTRTEGKAQVQRKNDEDDGGPVTYSAVRMAAANR